MPTLNINGHNKSSEGAERFAVTLGHPRALQMAGTKFGCGAGLCGACSVHVNGEAVRSCQTMVGDAVG